MNRLLRLRASERGFTLVELLVVMSILAVLAAVVIPTVTGVNTVARNTAQPADIKEVETAATRFNSDSASWPTNAPIEGSAWEAGSLPTLAYTVTSGNNLTFGVNAVARVNFAASSSGKTFSPDYTSKPKHISDTISVTAGGSSSAISLVKGGATYTVTLTDDSGAVGDKDFPAWALDKTGQVWVFVNKDTY